MVARGPITTTIFLAVMWCLFPGTPIQTAVKIAEMSDKAKVTEMITVKKKSPVIFHSGGLGVVFTNNSLHLPTSNGMHCTGDAIKMGEDVGARTIDLEWVQVHPAGLVKPDDPDAKIKFLAGEALRGVGLVFDALGNLFAYELGRRDYVTGEMWKNKPPFRLALNRAASDEIAWHCKHYTGRGVMKFYESGAALDQDMGVPVSKEESSEAHYQASLTKAEDPDGGHPVYLSGKSWDEASGKTGSGKKVDHNVISGADFAARPHAAVITPVIHGCMGGLEIEKIQQCWVRIPSPFLPSTQLERLQEVCTATTDWEAILCWIACFLVVFWEWHVRSKCWAIERKQLLSRRLLVEARVRGQKSGQASLGRNSFTSGLRGLRPRGRCSMCQVREEEEQMNFAIIKPVIHTGGLENDENSTVFYHSDLGNGLRSAALLRCLITPVIQCWLFWTLRIRVCSVWV